MSAGMANAADVAQCRDRRSSASKRLIPEVLQNARTGLNM